MENKIIKKACLKKSTTYMKPYALKAGEKKYRTEHELGIDLLRFGMEDYAGIKIDKADMESVISIDKYGKPYLPGLSGIHFNISHCDSVVACALSEKPVGIDIEKIDEFGELTARKILTEGEYASLQRYKSAPKYYHEFFFRLWTLKESYLKCEGSGFFRDPKDISFEIEQDGENSKMQIVCSDHTVAFYQEKIDDEFILTICTKI